MFKFAAIVASGLAFSVNGEVVKQDKVSNPATIQLLQAEIKAANAMIDNKLNYMHRLQEIQVRDLQKSVNDLGEELAGTDISKFNFDIINGRIKRIRAPRKQRARNMQKNAVDCPANLCIFVQ